MWQEIMSLPDQGARGHRLITEAAVTCQGVLHFSSFLCETSLSESLKSVLFFFFWQEMRQRAGAESLHTSCPLRAEEEVLEIKS